MTSRTDAGATPAALVSIHDLMPSTMPAVRRALDLLSSKRTTPVTLLVVPGSGWSRDEIRELKALERNGHPLAGHGWLHRTDRFGGAYHRLHGLTISRRVAEHLALDDDGIVALINRCHAWFGDNGLDPPALYVPPAWAMGSAPPERLADECPFPLYETFTGIFDADCRRYRRIPMLGYEADQRLRIPVIRLWNALNRHWALTNGVLRIGIHPNDPELHLRRDLVADLERYRITRDYSSLLVRS